MRENVIESISKKYQQFFHSSAILQYYFFKARYLSSEFLETFESIDAYIVRNNAYHNQYLINRFYNFNFIRFLLLQNATIIDFIEL